MFHYFFQFAKSPIKTSAAKPKLEIKSKYQQVYPIDLSYDFCYINTQLEQAVLHKERSKKVLLLFF